MSDYANLVNLLRDPGVDTLIDRIAAAVAAIEALVRERDAARERVMWFEASGGVAAHTRVFQEMARAEQAEAALTAEREAHEQERAKWVSDFQYEHQQRVQAEAAYGNAVELYRQVCERLDAIHAAVHGGRDESPR